MVLSPKRDCILKRVQNFPPALPPPSVRNICLARQKVLLLARGVPRWSYQRRSCPTRNACLNVAQKNSRSITQVSCMGLFIGLVNPFRAAVPFWGQITQNLSVLSPKQNCGSKEVKYCVFFSSKVSFGWVRRFLTRGAPEKIGSTYVPLIVTPIVARLPHRVNEAYVY